MVKEGSDPQAVSTIVAVMLTAAALMVTAAAIMVTVAIRDLLSKVSSYCTYWLGQTKSRSTIRIYYRSRNAYCRGHNGMAAAIMINGRDQKELPQLLHRLVWRKKAQIRNPYLLLRP